MKTNSKTHLTAHDKKVLKASLDNDFQNVWTPKKRLEISSISKDRKSAIGELYKLEAGIGIGSKQQWQKQIVEFYK